MSNNGVFVKKEQAMAGVVDGKVNVAGGKTYQGVQYKDAENPSEYKFDNSANGMLGTILPLGSDFGGVQGSKNPHGQIIPGEEITRGPNGTERSLGQVISHLAVDDSDEPKESSAPSSVEQVEMSEDMVEIEGTVDEEPEEQELHRQSQDTDIRAVLDRAVQETQEREQIPNKPAKSIRVKFTGNFGSYRGIYRHVCVNKQFVVLVYGLNASVYTPPAGEDKFTLSCDGEDYGVYFAGIEFELPFIDAGLQIMIREQN